jgi:CDP-paratose 2-epimerase
MAYSGDTSQKIFNVGGGLSNSMSLAQLSAWCDDRFGKHPVTADLTPRPFDIPWLVMDSSRARLQFNWSPRKSLSQILDEIATHARENPAWLELTGAI